MPNQAFATLNGIAQSWSDIGITLQLQDGPQLVNIDFVDLKFESSVEVGDFYGVSGGRKMKRTTGKLSETASATLYAGEGGADTLRKMLATVAPRRGDEALISLVVFDIIAQHTPFGATQIRKVEILGCRAVKFGEAYSDSTDFDKCEVDFSIAKIVHSVDGQKTVLL